MGARLPSLLQQRGNRSRNKHKVEREYAAFLPPLLAKGEPQGFKKAGKINPLT
jgi:hypothetical protein